MVILLAEVLHCYQNHTITEHYRGHGKAKVRTAVYIKLAIGFITL